MPVTNDAAITRFRKEPMLQREMPRRGARLGGSTHPLGGGPLRRWSRRGHGGDSGGRRGGGVGYRGKDRLRDGGGGGDRGRRRCGGG